MTTTRGSEELRVLAPNLIDDLRSLHSQLDPQRGAAYMQHTNFCDRASEFAAYIESSVELSQRGFFAQAFALLRSALDQWAADLVALLGDRYVQLYDNATEAVLNDAVDRWSRGELPSVAEEPRLVGRGQSKLRIVRRGLTADDGSMVLHPIYFEATNYDPFYGPPDEQPWFADWLDESSAHDHATEQRQRYNALFKWGALVDSLVLNRLVADGHRLHLNVHYRFLSAFVHSHHQAHRLLGASSSSFGSGPAQQQHAVEELVLLYAVQLSARYLDAFVKMADRPPPVGLVNRAQIEVLVALSLERTAHLWFLTDEPHLYDRGQELLARSAEAREFRRNPNPLAAAMELASDEVRYYRNPLDRLRRLHQSATEMVTGFTYISPWASSDR